MHDNITKSEQAVIDSQKNPAGPLSFGPMRLTAIGITSDRPPEVVDLLAAGQMIDRCQSGTNWWLGDWLVYAENTKGMAGILDQAIAGWSISLASLEQYKRVSQEWPLRLRDAEVGWAIHRAALGLEHVDDRLELLSQAKDKGLTVREALKTAREIKHRRIAAAGEDRVKENKQFAYAIAEPKFWVPDGIVGMPGSPVQDRNGQKPATDWASLDICGMLHADATVYILTTPTTIDEALSLAKKWGLVYRTVMSLSWQEPADTYYYHAANNQAIVVVATVGYPGRTGEPDGSSVHPDSVGAREWLYGHLGDLYGDEPGVAVFAKPPAEFKADYAHADLIGVKS